jgi:zinc-ribbon domain
MTCPHCNAELDPSDRFCGECGQAVIVRERADTGLAALPQEQSGTYCAEISREKPGCLLFLIDQSGSMARRITGGEQQKKQAVADAINRLLYNTVLRCAKEDGVRPYFDIGVFGYGVDGRVQSAFDADLLSVTDIADRPKRTETRRRRVPASTGDISEEEFQLPVWFEPVADGKTVMNAAFERAFAAVSRWASRHPHSFPPVIVHITDGGYTDKNPAQTAAKVRGVTTRDGNALVFNCHISEKKEVPVIFPNDSQAAGFQKRMRQLYDMSSPLPASLLKQAQAKGYAVASGARGYAFNADLVTLIDFLDIGTRVVQDHMEDQLQDRMSDRTENT